MKSRFKLILACISGLISVITYSQGNPYILGKLSFDKMDYVQADSYFSSFLTSFPKNKEARVLRAESNLSLSNFSKALDDLKELKISKDEEILLLQARAYAGIGDNQLAIEKLKAYKFTNSKISDAIIKAYPEFTNLKTTKEWMILWKDWKYTEKENSLIDAKYALKSERMGEAADRLDMYLQKYQNNAEAYYLRGNIYYNTNEYSNALEYYQNAVILDDDNFNYLNAKAFTYHKLKKDRKALEDFNSIISQDSLFIDAYLGRAQVLLAMTEYQSAFDDISKFIYYYPDHIEALHTEAQINIGLGDFLSAISEYGKLIKLCPEKPDYYVGRADAYMQTKTYVYAIRDYSMALDIDPNNSEIYKKKGLAFQLSGDIKSACSEWKQAVRHGDIESISLIQKYCKD